MSTLLAKIWQNESAKYLNCIFFRPKKAAHTRPSAGSLMSADDDPCMVSTVTESILPLIPERPGLTPSNSSQPAGAAPKNQGTQVKKYGNVFLKLWVVRDCSSQEL